MRKILIATPLRGDLPPEYIRTLVSLLSAKLPETKFIYAFLGGCTVQWARDELAELAIKHGCTHVLFWDKDLEPTPEQAVKLLSHDVDVVAALYTKRHVNTHWHVFGDPRFKDDERKDGLMRVMKVAIGFSLIKTSVFAKLKAHFPERQYYKRDGGEEPTTLHEYFPMGIVGNNSIDGKFRQIRSLIANTSKTDTEIRAEVYDIINAKDYSENQIRGEDFYFCELCLEAGVELYIDPTLMIPHNGEVRYPIPTPLLLQMLEEPWRQDEIRALRQPKQGEDEPLIVT